MKKFELLVKPTSADCNLHCDYCFYLEKRHLYPNLTRHRMSESVLDHMIKSYMATEQPIYSFVWQGGEPTLMGIDFFRKVVRLQEKYKRVSTTITNSIQTNATLIDEEMAKYFERYHFFVGCSLDGPAETHNRYRHTSTGNPSHASVLRSIKLLKRYKVEFNILTLVSQSNVHQAREIYRYLVHQGYLYQQYIPCVEFNEKGELLPFAINDEEWGEFICELFDEWYKHDIFTVSIRHFDSILLKMVNGASTICTMGSTCCQYFVVEYNGDIYPCDFFVKQQLKLGNIMDTSWEKVLTSLTYHNFGAQKTEYNETCETCDCLDFCRGDCLKYRIYAGKPAQNSSWLCAGWKRFIRHTRERFEVLSREVRRRQMEDRNLMLRNIQKLNTTVSSIGRNHPCSCNSGKKFKKCCGR